MYDEILRVKAQREIQNCMWNDRDLDEVHKRRENGDSFTWEDHLEALMLSILSANRPWYQIQQSKNQLRVIFMNYNPVDLYNADPEVLIRNVCSINCGNKRIAYQMKEISYNITVLKRIEDMYGDVDYLAKEAVRDPLSVMTKLSMPNGLFKLKGVGKALALEYLKRVGVDVVKPDIHVRRILQRFGYFNYLPSEEETFNLVKDMSVKLELPMYVIGSILWGFCATGYMEICGANPKCNLCAVQCKSSICAPDNVDLVKRAKWYTYIIQVYDVQEEIERLHDLYGTYDFRELVDKLGL